MDSRIRFVFLFRILPKRGRRIRGPKTGCRRFEGIHVWSRRQETKDGTEPASFPPREPSSFEEQEKREDLLSLIDVLHVRPCRSRIPDARPNGREDIDGPSCRTKGPQTCGRSSFFRSLSYMEDVVATDEHFSKVSCELSIDPFLAVGKL